MALNQPSLRFLSSDEKQAFRMGRKLGTGLTYEEIRKIRWFYRKLGREPTEIELQTFGQTWSEHCFHKTFKSKVICHGSKNATVNGIFRTYIRKATEEIAAEWIVSAFSDNAGIIRFEKDYSIAAKVETHNHPSAVDPYGGAATGVGGVIRDVLGVWAKPIANTDVLSFGNLYVPYSRLPPGAKHAKYLLKGVISGVGAYGNNMGIPTVNGGIYFGDGFNGYTLVFCGCVGLLKNRNYVHSAKPGHILLLAGARTGRDGIHGVSFASKRIGEKIDQLRDVVQIPDPISEEKLSRAVLEIGDRRLASAITDLGGGGLSSAVCETARSYGCGATLDLATVPTRTSEIEPWQVWLSESQERMLIVVPEENLGKTLSIFENEEVEANVIGKLTKRPQIELRYREHRLSEIDLHMLFQPPLHTMIAKTSRSLSSVTRAKQTKLAARGRLEEDMLAVLSSPNVCSREPVIRTYDHEVGGRTVIKPLQSPFGGPNDAAVIKPLGNSKKGLAISCGFNPSYGMIDAYWMAASAIDEAIRNNVCVGGRRIALLDNFAWGDPEKPEAMGELVRAAEACYDIAKAYGAPFISGKDSLYNATPLGDIPPTLVATALGIVPDISQSISADFKEAGDSIYLVGNTFSELGGSEFNRLFGVSDGIVPKVDPSVAAAVYRALNCANDRKVLRACHDVSMGGIAVALIEMCFASMLGAEIVLPKLSDNRGQTSLSVVETLFSESNSRFVIEVRKDDEHTLEKILDGLPFWNIGTTSFSSLVSVRDSSGKILVRLRTSDCYDAWHRFPLEG